MPLESECSVFYEFLRDSKCLGQREGDDIS